MDDAPLPELDDELDEVLVVSEDDLSLDDLSPDDLSPDDSLLVDLSPDDLLLEPEPRLSVL